jgi:hypothetical protein
MENSTYLKKLNLETLKRSNAAPQWRSISGATFSSVVIVFNDADRSTSKATRKRVVSYRVANDEV